MTKSRRQRNYVKLQKLQGPNSRTADSIKRPQSTQKLDGASRAILTPNINYFPFWISP